MRLLPRTPLDLAQDLALMVLGLAVLVLIWRGCCR